ncbi:MAG: universal stress protein, partial [Cyclobacteriaceae bacterium]|nr:universal stress protein [Cyclobacteriaceae bacterium HetDA_MAG_MS6]
ARKCPCSLLLVTQDCALKIDKLLVPIDFSDHSVLAMHLASAMQEGSKASLETVHVYGVPIGYYKTGKSYEEFAEIMRNHAAKDFSRFLEKHHFPISTSCTYILTDDGKYPELTYDYAVEHGTNIIVIGSRGRTNISALLMGSTAEKLVFLSKDIPVLIAKEKGENMGFLDTLMKI